MALSLRKMVLLGGITGSLLVGCSDPAPAPEKVETTTPSPVEVAPPPQLPESQKTSIQIPKEIEDTANSSKQESLDNWYITRLQEADVHSDRNTLFALRESVCSSLQDGSTVENLSRTLGNHPLHFTESQKGVIIASAMISSCQDTSLSIDKANLPPSRPAQR